MPLDATAAKWIFRFSNGKVDVVDPQTLTPEERDEHAVRQRIEAQEADEREKKRVLIEKATAAIEKHKEVIRAANDLTIEYTNDENKRVQESLVGPEHKAFEIEELKGDGQRDLKFRKDGLFGQREVAYKDVMKNAYKAMDLILKEVETLSKIKTKRPKDPYDANPNPAMEEQSLFSDQEIAAEIFTPLIRENVLAPTFVPDKWSETQSMLDGSDKYYIKECQEKGAEAATGAVALTKGAIAVTSQVVGAIFTGLGAPKSGQVDISHGLDISKNQEAVYSSVNAGITAVLTLTVDVPDKLVDLYRSGDLDGWKSVDFSAEIGSLATGIGQIVTGATQNADIGGEVAIGIAGCRRVSNLTKMFHEWGKGKDRSAANFPWNEFLDEASGIALDGLNVMADNTDGDVSTMWSNIASETSVAVKTALAGQKAIMNVALGNGNWGDFMDVFSTAMNEGAKATTAILTNNVSFNLNSNYDPNAATDGTKGTTVSGIDQQGSQLAKDVPVVNDIDQIKITDDYDTAKTSYSEEYSASSQQSTVESSLDKTVAGAMGLIKGKFAKGIKTDREKDSGKIQAEFEKIKKQQEALKKAKDEAAKKQADVLKAMLETEQKEYEDALNCLGSTNPDDAEYKSIAKLIEKIEADRKFVDGLFAIFGGGLGAASGISSSVANLATEVLPVLSAAGQLVKMVANAKAAYERIRSYMAWSDSKKDAVSANSVYYTTIKNFQANMRNQSLQYSAQALANFIQVGLNAAQVSPFAPIFKATSTAVSAAAAAEDALYKFYQQRQLVKAWEMTKQAIDPENKGNRKMRLMVRRLNPTLAKYTIAYGALIRKDPIAIGALGRCNLDRETLTRADDKVADVKKYLETLYKDDGKVLVTIDIEKGTLKTPDVSLDAKTWSVTYAMLSKDAKLATANPPKALTFLALAEAARATLEDLPEPDPDDVETPKEELAKQADKRTKAQGDYKTALEEVEKVFRAFVAVDGENKALPSVQKVTERYADEAAAAIQALDLETSPPPDHAEVALSLIASAKKGTGAATTGATQADQTTTAPNDDERDQPSPRGTPPDAQQTGEARANN